jgi:pyruvate dehydrogenase E1 component alpha subunit/2-oxoisovalerate dehydrogenase E1 component alpha subunit
LAAPSPPTLASAQGVAAGLTREQLVELYHWMRLTRTLEEKLVNLYRQTKVIGGLFRSLGQEADAVGTAFALDRTKGDILAPLTRNLGSILVMGATPLEVLRQYMAKAEGPSRGRDLNIHFNDLERGFIGQISHLGDMVPVMCGVTLSFRMRREPRVGMVYVGDGATSTGSFHEGVNFAAVQRLPLVVIVENNGYAYSTPLAKQTAARSLVEKAAGYGVPGRQADGNDVLAVYEATKEAVERARAGGGVTLIELLTYRRKGHAEHDNQSYVAKEELAAWEARDPIDLYVRRLTGSGWAVPEELAAIDARIAGEIDTAIGLCEGEPMPAPETALADVSASPPSAELEWYRRLDG